ncbi:ABC transporter permease [Ensifer aridi]|uniref:ABC transporter permease n=1 Tax=Ensifer aridi TaxID=1708715 RepID=UPI000422DD08|nr:ABC transporter permease [Ensifer aridi]
MQSYIIKRLLSAVVVMWAVATIVFFAMRVVPADPAEVVLGDYASQELITSFRHKMGLDLPIWQQYVNFLTGLLHGDLGRSMVTNQPVAEQIFSLFPYTLSLALASLFVGAAIGIPLGVVTAVRRNTIVDSTGRLFALAGFSFPAFYLGVILLIIFSVHLKWFPVVHSVNEGAELLEHLHKLVLPAFSLGLIQAAYITRLTRSAMLETLSQDYVRTAHAKGLPADVVFFKHALRNVLIPVVTAMGLYTGSILGGSVLTETVFSRPGLGKLLIGAIAQRDYTLIQSGLMMFAFVVLIVNLLVDLSYVIFDPRVKYD